MSVTGLLKHTLGSKKLLLNASQLASGGGVVVRAEPKDSGSNHINAKKIVFVFIFCDAFH